MPDTQISDEMVERAARGICISAGDDPDRKTYAREMACTGNDREPKLRWEFWAGHARAALEAALSGHVVGWREITEDNEPPRDVELLLGWWRTWPERKWECASGLYGSTKGRWIHGNATHWQNVPAPPEMERG